MSIYIFNKVGTCPKDENRKVGQNSFSIPVEKHAVYQAVLPETSRDGQEEQDGSKSSKAK